MMNLALGIDTSNYKTSIALVDRDNNIIYDDRAFLRVSNGEKGLRQQEALFQHINRLPNMIRSMFTEMDLTDKERYSIDVVAVSDRPRNVDGSYMPCFNAGVSIGKTLATTLNVPIKFYSHQDGHIAAGKRFTALENSNEFIAFHFSGGTTEALKCVSINQDYKVEDVSPYSIEIIGGTKDISYGQLIDRIGVAMGYPFPAGEEIDNGAIRMSSGGVIFDSNHPNHNNDMGLNNDLVYKASEDYSIPSIKVNDAYINLSGIETSVLKLIENNDYYNKDAIAYKLMIEISKSILGLTKLLNEQTGINDFLYVGGVSSSSFIRSFLEKEGRKKGLNIHFASPELASDNAVGIAFLGGDATWL